MAMMMADPQPLALAVMDHGVMRSANCVACHIEHRGAKLLSAVDDATCTKCHANIQPALEPGMSLTIDKKPVTVFDDKGGHPYFGRERLKVGKVFLTPEVHGRRLSPPTPAILIDPIRLKFFHSINEHKEFYHDDCSMCHVGEGRGARADSRFASESKAGSQSGSRLDLKRSQYMRPVYSFAKDCQSCHYHKMQLTGGVNTVDGPALPHVRMDLVLGKIAHVEDFYGDWLRDLSEADRNKVLRGMNVKDRIEDLAKRFREDVGKWASGVKSGDLPCDQALEKDLITRHEDIVDDTALAGKDIRVVSAYVAYGQCAVCHDVSLSTNPTTTVAATQTSADPKGILAANTMTPFSTVPTGFPATGAEPPRWFVHSTFDHRAAQGHYMPQLPRTAERCKG